MIDQTTQRVNRNPQKVKNGSPGSAGKQALSAVQRETFVTSREMDFFSEKELVNQTGHDRSEWPFVIAKELIDNVLDACEDLDIPPEIVVTADASGITVSDNGPGLPESTLQGTLNFAVRVSSREAYVAPDRGAQGNALKTLAAMPYVLDSEGGRLVVEACGTLHEISVHADPVSQRPVVRDETTKSSKSGTTIGVKWTPQTDEEGNCTWPFGRTSYLSLPGRFEARFLRLIEGFAIFNPHATITLNWFGKKRKWEATDPTWNKWKPSRPTSPHWYGVEHLERLIAAYVTHDRDNGNESRTVGEFLKQFDGLAGSSKRRAVLADVDMHRLRLEELVGEDGLRGDAVAGLLTAMQTHTKPVKPQRLGLIGEDHFRARLLEMGIEAASFRYKKIADFEEGLPCVVETAFGYRGVSSRDDRLIHAGANWSAAIHNPFRAFGSTGEGLDAYLRELLAGQSEPIVFCIHLAHPRISYTDRGKSALAVR